MGDLLTGSGDLHPSRHNISKYPHLSSIDFGNDNGAKLEMIIGVAHIDTWIAGNVQRGPSNQPMGIRTAFGWTIVGSQGRMNSTNITVSALSLDNDILKEDLQRIFYHDFPLVTEEENGNFQDNRKAVCLLENSIHFNKERGKFVLALPWKYGRQQSADILNSVDSRSMALRRLKSMTPKLKRDEKRKQIIFGNIKKFKDKGIPVPVDKALENPKAIAEGRPIWHLPLMCVDKPTKIRICHNARAKAGGICLNDLLLGGPNLTNSLARILILFCKYKYVFCTDIA